MDNLLFYLLKVSAGTALLYLCYLLLFRKDTFYKRNRVLLILILLIPTLFPVLKIPVYRENPVAVQQVISENIDLPVTPSVVTMNAAKAPFDYRGLLAGIYLTVAGLLLLRVFISLFSTYKKIKKGTLQDPGFPRIVISGDQLPPFSFFPYAVIPAEDFKSGNYTDLLDHEFAHIRQGHTFDLILSELFIAFQWFNPFVWMIKRSIALNHEYLADQVSLSNKSVKEYQYRLLNFQPELKHVSLAHNFNSLIKNRIIMINRKPTNRYAVLKGLLILPVAAFLAYSFATPDYRTVASVAAPISINETPALIQKGVKGVVLNEDGKPLPGVMIMSTGKMGEATGAQSGPDGRFSFEKVEKDASLVIFLKGYKPMNLKPDFGSEMTIKLVRDPDFKEPVAVPITNTPGIQPPSPIVVIDGTATEKNYTDATKELGYNMGIAKFLQEKEATEKYGDKGAKGAIEITTRKKAIELGLKPAFPRISPADFPTFQNLHFIEFEKWVKSQTKYPAEAQSKGVEGWVTVKYTVELDGSLSNISASSTSVDPLLNNEIIRVVTTSPKWDPPKNSAVDEPFSSSATVKFKLPDQIGGDIPFVVVEEMPMYPGGDVELLNFIKNNTVYPEDAKRDKIQGRVILRFVVNKEGNTEGISVLRGVHPLLDAEAMRVVSSLKGFKPGKQGGNPVDVWYMVPVTFSIPEYETIFSKNSVPEVLKFLGSNIGYPEKAKNASDTGTVYVVIKTEKGGTLSDCKAFSDKAGITVPLLPEIVVVGYKPDNNNAIPGNNADNEHAQLKEECIRIAGKLTELNIPELKEKDLEFAVPFKFILK